MYIDSHAHLYDTQFEQDLSAVLARAHDAGVDHIIVPATNIATSRASLEMAEKYDGISVCVGYHPHDAAEATDKGLQEIEELSSHPKVVGIGEIGLDFHYDFAPRDVQKKVFESQIQLAIRRDLPIVVHTRNSIEETLVILKECLAGAGSWRRALVNVHSSLPSPKGVFHCFSGTSDQAIDLISLGFSISFPGIVTFKNSPVLQTLKAIGYDHLLLETDSPYMAPVPKRGKRNEPSYLPIIADAIAGVSNGTVEDVARTARFNTKRLFGIGEPESPKIVYQIGRALYLNITLRCNADCVFCDRKGEAIVKGYNLKITREPSVEELIREIGDPSSFDEIVLCGYGEPTIRLDVVKEVAQWVHSRNGSVRLNTDGHGSIINKRNIVPELVGLVDSVSISLNSADPDQYGKLMRIDGATYHQAMTDFARECKKLIGEVVLTIVDVPGVDVGRARRLADQELGIPLKVRPLF